MQQRPVKRNCSQHYHRPIATPNKTMFTLRTSVGEFVFHQTPLGCHLELVVGNARLALGLYGTNEAAVRALKNGRTGFRTWDALDRRTAGNQIGTLSAGIKASRRHERHFLYRQGRELHVSREGERETRVADVQALPGREIHDRGFRLSMLGLTSVVHAQTPDSTAGTSSAGARELLIDPSSASVALWKASLIVTPLTHRDGNYVGDYQLKVRPYFFKSEKGSLLLAVSDDAVRKLQAGTAINFAGQALKHKDGRTHIVLGRATPSSRDRGSVTFSIVTDDARIVFNTSYHFPAPRP
jgi:hypothetical protein